MRSWVRELAHERRDRSRGHRIRERLSMRKLRRDCKPIFEHAATLCSYPRNVTVNRCRAGGRGALRSRSSASHTASSVDSHRHESQWPRRSWHGRQRRQKGQGKKQATTTEQTEGRGTKKAGQKPAANSAGSMSDERQFPAGSRRRSGCATRAR